MVGDELIIAATADIHSPHMLSLFRKSLGNYNGTPDLFILAGDIVDRNRIEYASPVFEEIRNRFSETPIIVVFGNEEYMEDEERYRSRYSYVRWLSDEYIVLTVRGEKYGIIGSRGSLERPTYWQAKNIPWIQRYYRELPFKLERLVEELRKKGVNSIILVTHYGVTYDTLTGEPRRIWPYLADPRIGERLAGKVSVIIHGHAHNSVRTTCVLKGTRIYNVSLPANKSIVEIRVAPSRQGLLRWLS